MDGDRGGARRDRPGGEVAGGGRGRGLVRLALAVGAVLALAAAVDRVPSPTAASEEKPPPIRDPAASAVTPPDLRAVAQRVATALPPRATLDRLAPTPHHVVVEGHVPDLDGVTEVVENLGRIPGIEEPDLRRAVRSERGVEFGVVLASSLPAAAEPGGKDRDPPPPPASAATPITRRLDRLLFPPPT